MANILTFLNQALVSYKKAWFRFPEVVLTSLSVAITAWIFDAASQNESLTFFDPLVKTLNVLWLLLPALLFNVMMFERFPKWKAFRWPMVALWTGLAILYWFIVEIDVLPNIVSLRYSFMQVSFLLLAITMPYYFEREKFAHYVVDVLTRLFQTILYSAVLYSGISLIYLAITILFNVSLNPFFFNSLYFGIFSFVFTPNFLGILPEQQKNYQGDYSVIWKTLFANVFIPLVSAFSIILVVFLVQNIVNPDVFAIQFYVFSSLLVGFVGLISISLLRPLTNKPFYVVWFERYFPYVALVIMAGFYYLLLLSGFNLFWSVGLFINAFLGLWVVFNAVFAIIKKWTQLQILALSAVDLLLIATLVPGINAVDLSTEFYKQEFVAILERNNMIDETTQTIIPQPGGLLNNEDETRLKDLVDEMASVGYHRFPYLPEDYEIYEFLAVFGFLPDGENGEENVIFINYNYVELNFIDLTDFKDHESLLFINSLQTYSAPIAGWTITYNDATSLLGLTQGEETLEIDMGDVLKTIYSNLDEVSSDLAVEDLATLTVTQGDITLYTYSIFARYDLINEVVTSVNGTFVIGIR